MLRRTTTLNKVLLAFRVATILVGITGAAGLGWASTEEYAISTDGLGIFLDKLLAYSLGFSALWSAIVLVITIVFNDPIHPGVFIGVDVLYAVLMVVVGTLGASSPVNQAEDLTCDGSSSYCHPIGDRTIIWRMVGTAFCYLSFVCHTTLFACACKVCTVRRKAGKQKQNIGAEHDTA